MTLHPDKPDPAPLFLEIRPGMRKALADAVEAFLNLLDQIDDDPDAEESDVSEDDAPCEDVGDDEPSLGSVGSRNESSPQHLWAQGAGDDCEATTGPRDEEDDDSDKGELDGDYMDSWFNPPHLPGGNGPTRRPSR